MTRPLGGSRQRHADGPNPAFQLGGAHQSDTAGAVSPGRASWRADLGCRACPPAYLPLPSWWSPTACRSKGSPSRTARSGWRVSPGGLVAALGPVMQRNQGHLGGLDGHGRTRKSQPFEAEGMRLVPVELTSEEVADYYEGFSNATLWPLYHDLTAVPAFHRPLVGGVPRGQPALRRIRRGRGRRARSDRCGCRTTSCSWSPPCCGPGRPDLRIGFFNHIPFPGYEIYSRLPWRRQIVEGLLGADLIGFQRGDDAANFLRACRQLTGADHARVRDRGPAGRRGRGRGAAGCGRPLFPSPSTPPPWRRWPGGTTSRPGPASYATTSATPKWSCSASTASTTPRASASPAGLR